LIRKPAFVLSTRRKKRNHDLQQVNEEEEEACLFAGLPKNNGDTGCSSTILRDEEHIVLH
jgi:hypothetical protein